MSTPGLRKIIFGTRSNQGKSLSRHARTSCWCHTPYQRPPEKCHPPSRAQMLAGVVQPSEPGSFERTPEPESNLPAAQTEPRTSTRRARPLFTLTGRRPRAGHRWRPAVDSQHLGGQEHFLIQAQLTHGETEARRAELPPGSM